MSKLEFAYDTIAIMESKIEGLEHRMAQGSWKVVKELEAKFESCNRARQAAEAEVTKLKEGVRVPKELSEADLHHLVMTVDCSLMTHEVRLTHKAIIEHFTKETPKDKGN